MARRSFMLVQICAVLLFSSAVSGQLWRGPRQTLPFAQEADVLGWSPKPTSAPPWPELLRRESTPHTLCGFFNGNACMLTAAAPGDSPFPY
jgi:hypothetical protein